MTRLAGCATTRRMSDTASPVVVPSVTKLPDVTGRVLVGGSHGGIYAAYLSLRAGARAALPHAAGGGQDDAGIGGLSYAERHGMAMATVASTSARIGDGDDMMARGLISYANAQATAAGVAPGMTCTEAARLLATAPWPHAEPHELAEARHVADGFPGRWRVLCLDSISLIVPGDRAAIVASGSHGGVPAGKTASGVGAGLVLFNDAGGGVDHAGTAGLAILDADQTPAATVAAMSARIGDGESTLRDGIISAANRSAERLDVRIGEAALDLVRRLTDIAHD
jgi:hypothetical protein